MKRPKQKVINDCDPEIRLYLRHLEDVCYGFENAGIICIKTILDSFFKNDSELKSYFVAREILENKIQELKNEKRKR